MTDDLSGIARWREFLVRMNALLDREPAIDEVLESGSAALSRLVAADDWLPECFAVPDPKRYRQYLLHRDPGDRFSVVSFVWRPGQATPIHDHGVWGLVGLLRGSEASRPFARCGEGGMQPAGPPHVLRPGDVERISPQEGDVHQVSNAHYDTSVSIHVYGGDIGRISRHSFGRDGSVSTFVSGYSPAPPPADWPGNLS